MLACFQDKSFITYLPQRKISITELWAVSHLHKHHTYHFPIKTLRGLFVSKDLLFSLSQLEGRTPPACMPQSSPKLSVWLSNQSSGGRGQRLSLGPLHSLLAIWSLVIISEEFTVWPIIPPRGSELLCTPRGWVGPFSAEQNVHRGYFKDEVMANISWHLMIGVALGS